MNRIFMSQYNFSTYKNNNCSLMKLPYDNLLPYISQQTIDFHYGKHHAGYIAKLNTLLQKNTTNYHSVFNIAKQNFEKNTAIYNNAAQIWNHDMFWNGIIVNDDRIQIDQSDRNFFFGLGTWGNKADIITKDKKLNPIIDFNKNMQQSIENKLHDDKDFIKLFINSFQSFENFKEQFVTNAMLCFGSGWVWLVYNKQNHALEIINTSNANIPSIQNNHLVELWVCDVWEHAYYLDTQNDRAQYVINILNIINWHFVVYNYTK